MKGFRNKVSIVGLGQSTTTQCDLKGYYIQTLLPKAWLNLGKGTYCLAPSLLPIDTPILTLSRNPEYEFYFHSWTYYHLQEESKAK